jgi:MFS family permease
VSLLQDNGNPYRVVSTTRRLTKIRRYQSRAFLLLPMCFNIGVIIGPILGGLLADPAKNYPHLFGPGSLLGGKHGVRWMQHWPFALPNFLSAVFIFASLLAVLLGLDEVCATKVTCSEP